MEKPRSPSRDCFWQRNVMSSSAVEKFTLVFEFDILKITVLKKYLPIEIGRYFY